MAEDGIARGRGLSVAQKVLMVALAPLTASALFAAFSLNKSLDLMEDGAAEIATVAAAEAEIAESILVVRSKMSQALLAMGHVDRTHARALVLGDTTMTQKVEDAKAGVIDGVRQLEGSVGGLSATLYSHDFDRWGTDADKARLTAIEDAAAAFPAQLARLDAANVETLARLRGGDPAAAIQNFVDVESALFDSTAAIIESAADDVEQLTLSISVQAQEIRRDVVRAKAADADAVRLTQSLILVAGLVVFALITTLIARRRISNPLCKAADVTNRLAQGDRDVALPPARGDEIGDVIAALAVFQANAREVERLRAESAAQEAAARPGDDGRSIRNRRAIRCRLRRGVGAVAARNGAAHV